MQLYAYLNQGILQFKNCLIFNCMQLIQVSLKCAFNFEFCQIGDVCLMFYVCLSMFYVCLSMSLCLFVYVYMPVCLCLYVCLSMLYVGLCLFGYVCLCLFLFVYVSMFMSVCLCVYVYVCLSNCPCLCLFV